MGSGRRQEQEREQSELPHDDASHRQGRQPDVLAERQRSDAHSEQSDGVAQPVCTVRELDVRPEKGDVEREIARAGMTVSASVLIVSRFAYGWYASRARADDGWTDSISESDDGAASRGRSEPEPKGDAPVPSPPSIPDGEPRETMTPVRASILAAGVVNAMTTGGVVDNRFGHWRQFTIRVGVAGMMVVAVLALLDGTIVVSAILAALFLGLAGALSAVSAVHMLLALGGVEYEFYESEVVAYDRYLGRPQWSASHDGVRNVSVERGLFGSPLWLDAGTVFFDRIPDPKDGESAREPRSSIAFVPEPERAGELIRSHSGEP